MITKKQIIIKRVFDFVFSLVGIVFLFPVLFLFILLSIIVFKANGVFVQERIGQYGKVFKIYKIRSLPFYKTKKENIYGRFLRDSKIDELPQLFNVLIGNMSFVGPRPDVKGFADMLKGKNRIVLSVKPGITGPASLYFKNEEEILERQENLEKYNNEIIWPKKVQLNVEYIKNYSFFKDIYYIFKTVF